MIQVGPKLKEYYRDVKDSVEGIARHLGLAVKAAQRDKHGLMCVHLFGPTYKLDRVPPLFRAALKDEQLEPDFTISFRR